MTFAREFTLDVVTDSKHAPEWQALRNKHIKVMQGCEFGFAEEIIGFIEYEDETFLVGVGESMRPFILLYEGQDAEKASAAFVLAICDRAME